MIPFEITAGGRRVTGSKREGEGPTLILLHAAGGNQHSFGPLLTALGDRPCVVPNLPGRLGSEGPPVDVAGAARIVVDLAGTLALERYVVVGHSMGGAVAIEVALCRPDGLVALVLLATGARLRVHAMLLELVAEATERGEHLIGEPGLWQPNTSRLLRETLERRWTETPPETVLADWRAADAFDRLHDLGGVTVPAMVVGGDEDVLTPRRYAEYLAQQLPAAHLEMLHGAGHLFPAERPVETAAVITEFVDALQRR